MQHLLSMSCPVKIQRIQGRPRVLSTKLGIPTRHFSNPVHSEDGVSASPSLFWTDHPCSTRVQLITTVECLPKRAFSSCRLCRACELPELRSSSLTTFFRKSSPKSRIHFRQNPTG